MIQVYQMQLMVQVKWILRIVNNLKVTGISVKTVLVKLVGAKFDWSGLSTDEE